MNRWIRLTVTPLVSLLIAGAGLAQSPPDKVPTSKSPAPTPIVPIPTESLEGFSSLLKKLVVQQLPPTLVFDNNHNWGHKAMVPTIQGVRVVRVLRNHGNWQQVRAVVPDVARNLELRVHDLRIRDAENLTFWIHLAAPTRVEFHQQTWQNGLMVMSNAGRARLRIQADIKVETEIKLDTKGGLLPDLIVRFKVADAKVNYDGLVLENINGIGGSAARVTGDTIRRALRQWKPSLERGLLEKARESVIRAGATREVHLNLARLIKLTPP